MSTIDTRISPALHPENIKSIDGYSDDTALVLGLTEAAFTEAYEGIRSIHDAKAAAAKNPTLTEGAKLLQVDDFAGKKLDKITRAFDAELARLDKAVAHLDAEMNQPVTAQASASLAAEIRAHVKGMKTGERQTFIQQAIDSGDAMTASSVLGAPAYLSGLHPEMAKVLLRQWHIKQNPEKEARLKAMQGAKALVERNGPLAIKAAIDAVGFITEPGSQRKIYAADIRKAREAAEKPFRDAA